MTSLLRAENPSNPYRKRWQHWYAAIADSMIAHPEWTQNEIAAHLKKNYTTISMIVNTDLFKCYFAERRRQFQEVHDQALTQKLTKLAGDSLDLLSSQLEKKKDLVPIKQVHEIALGALDRLGFAPKTGPSVVVQNNQQNNYVAPSASLDALRQAQEAMRRVEQLRASEPMRQQLPISRDIDALFVEGGLIDGETVDVVLEPDGTNGASEDEIVSIGDGDDLLVPSKR